MIDAYALNQPGRVALDGRALFRRRVASPTPAPSPSPLSASPKELNLPCTSGLEGGEGEKDEEDEAKYQCRRKARRRKISMMPAMLPAIATKKDIKI